MDMNKFFENQGIISYWNECNKTVRGIDIFLGWFRGAKKEFRLALERKVFDGAIKSGGLGNATKALKEAIADFEKAFSAFEADALARRRSLEHENYVRAEQEWLHSDSHCYEHAAKYFAERFLRELAKAECKSFSFSQNHGVVSSSERKFYKNRAEWAQRLAEKLLAEHGVTGSVKVYTYIKKEYEQLGMGLGPMTWRPKVNRCFTTCEFHAPRRGWRDFVAEYDLLVKKVFR